MAERALKSHSRWWKRHSSRILRLAIPLVISSVSIFCWKFYIYRLVVDFPARISRNMGLRAGKIGLMMSSAFSRPLCVTLSCGSSNSATLTTPRPMLYLYPTGNSCSWTSICQWNTEHYCRCVNRAVCKIFGVSDVECINDLLDYVMLSVV